MPRVSDAGRGIYARRLPNRRTRSPQPPAGRPHLQPLPPPPPAAPPYNTAPRRAEAPSPQADALRIDFRPGGEIGQSVARIGYLVEADDSPMLAFALAAPSKIEAHRHIAPLGKLPGHNAL